MGRSVKVPWRLVPTTSELNDQALTHEVGSICFDVRIEGIVLYWGTYGKLQRVSTSQRVIRMACSTGMRLTRDDITSVHSILVFHKAEAVHELDLCDLSGAMGSEMVRDILFCG